MPVSIGAMKRYVRFSRAVGPVSQHESDAQHGAGQLDARIPGRNRCTADDAGASSAADHCTRDGGTQQRRRGHASRGDSGHHARRGASGETGDEPGSEAGAFLGDLLTAGQ